MAKQLDNRQKRELARELYVSTNLSQKEIAAKVGCSENSIGKWKESENWEDLKAINKISRPEMLRMFYAQINQINTNISNREDGEKFASSSESDTLVKLSKAIKNLENELGIADAVNFSIGFLTWLRGQDVEKAQEFSTILDGYIKDLQSKS